MSAPKQAPHMSHASRITHHLSRVTLLGLRTVILITGLLAFSAMLGLEIAGCDFLYDPSAPYRAETFGRIMVPLFCLSFVVLGWLITTYQPQNRIGWLCGIGGLCLLLGQLGYQYAGCAVAGPLALPAVSYVSWLAYISSAIGLVALMIFLPLWFPNGQFVSTRWRQIGTLMAMVAVGLLLTLAFWPGPLDKTGYPPLPGNPFGLDFIPSPVLDQFLKPIWPSLIMIFVLLANLSLIHRWRLAHGDLRQQLKWYAFFLGTFVTFFIAIEFFGLLYYPAIFFGWFYLLVLALVWLGYPLVIGFTIFKFRLYDIDIIINRTLVYGALTVLLGLIYFGSVVLSQAIFTAVSGQQSPIAIVLSTLLIAALFTPLRQRLQRFIDRRFYRRKYDAERTLAAFAKTARDEVDLDHLTAELTHVIDHAMRPESVSLWIRQ